MEGLVAYGGNETQMFSNSDITILQFYFSSFDYPIYHLTEKQWPDFFCEKAEFTGLKKFIKPINLSMHANRIFAECSALFTCHKIWHAKILSAL